LRQPVYAPWGAETDKQMITDTDIYFPHYAFMVMVLLV
jgi:hypothetical protein